MTTAAERRELARIAAGTRWSKPGARARQAAAARTAMVRALIRQVDPDGVMSPDELRQAVESAASVQSARLRLAKIRKREADSDDPT